MATPKLQVLGKLKGEKGADGKSIHFISAGGPLIPVGEVLSGLSFKEFGFTECPYNLDDLVVTDAGNILKVTAIYEDYLDFLVVADINGEKGEQGEKGDQGEKGNGIYCLKFALDETETRFMYNNSVIPYTVGDYILATNGNLFLVTGVNSLGKTYISYKACLKGADGQTPFIGENGNWWIGETDTGVSASGSGGSSSSGTKLYAHRVIISDSEHVGFISTDDTAKTLSSFIKALSGNDNALERTYFAGKEFTIVSADQNGSASVLLYYFSVGVIRSKTLDLTGLVPIIQEL